VLYRYAFRRVGVSNLKILSEEIPLFNQPTLVSQFGVTWFRDSRDNPAEASKGSFNSADFSDADTRLGSSASFLRFFLQNSTYYPIKRRFSFARSARLGVLVPMATRFPDFSGPAAGQCIPGTAHQDQLQRSFPSRSDSLREVERRCAASRSIKQGRAMLARGSRSAARQC